MTAARQPCQMADSLQLGEQCPLCRERGWEGRLELRQINAFEALWICGNLKVSQWWQLEKEREGWGQLERERGRERLVELWCFIPSSSVLIQCLWTC